MIKANELRIGNYLKSEDGVVVKIDALSIYHIWDKSKEYLPIPLTEEWLLKFGFEKVINGGNVDYCKPLFLGEHYSETELIINFEYGSFLGWEEINTPIYVHTLQNLYFALAREEL